MFSDRHQRYFVKLDWTNRLGFVFGTTYPELDNSRHVLHSMADTLLHCDIQQSMCLQGNNRNVCLLSCNAIKAHIWNGKQP